MSLSQVHHHLAALFLLLRGSDLWHVMLEFECRSSGVARCAVNPPALVLFGKDNLNSSSGSGPETWAEDLGVRTDLSPCRSSWCGAEKEKHRNVTEEWESAAPQICPWQSGDELVART